MDKIKQSSSFSKLHWPHKLASVQVSFNEKRVLLFFVALSTSKTRVKQAKDQILDSEGEGHDPGSQIPVLEESHCSGLVGGLSIWLHDYRDKHPSNHTR